MNPPEIQTILAHALDEPAEPRTAHHMGMPADASENRKQPSDLEPAGRIIEKLADEIVRLEKEVANLQAWKDSALAIENEWDVQELAKLLDAKPGASCRKTIDQGVRRLLAENQILLHCADFVVAVAEMTTGNGEITRSSHVAPGVTLRRRARDLVARMVAFNSAKTTEPL